MIDLEKFPEKIFIESESMDFPLTKSILKKFQHKEIKVIKDTRALMEEFSLCRDPVGEGKKHLFLTRQKGEFIKPCPCTPRYIGCNYFIVNLDLNCPLDCSYCILQHYLSSPLITIHVNTEALWNQLDTFRKRRGSKILRLGTGELGDSLVLDHITERSRDLISYFKCQPKTIFELKTKTSNIRNLMMTEPSGNIVIAWSLNSEEVAAKEEKGAPPVVERINSAYSVLKKGFRVAFHFDPIIRYPGWEEGYADVIDKLLKKIPLEKIAWISLGSLRFPAPLKSTIQSRFPESKIIYEEFIRGKDGKLRYFKPNRRELYRSLIKCFRTQRGLKIPIYLCMESQEIWKEVFGKKPPDTLDVEESITSNLGCR